MFRVVLIDDEALVLKGMSMVLEKDENIQLVGTASTGPEGLDLIYKEKPDIVFTDIRMPGMTGLEMIEKAQERFPEIVYIIFSGFNEFKYVQKAIGLGVLDYLEKPVTVQDLKTSLARAGKILEYKRNYTQMKAQVAQVNKVVIEQLFYKLIHQPPEFEEKTIKELIETDEAFSYITEAAILCVGKVMHEDNREDAYRQIINELTFTLTEGHSIRFFTLSVDENIYFVYLNEECLSFEFYEKLTGAKEKLEELGISFVAGISNIHHSIYEIKNGFMEAKNALTYATFMDEETIIRNEEVEYQNQIPIGIMDSHYSLELNFRLGNYEESRKQIETYFSYLETDRLMPEVLKHECMEILYLLINLVQESGKKPEMLSDRMLNEKVKGLISANEIIEWSRKYAVMLMDQAEEKEKPGGKDSPVKIISRYIDENYDKSITLDILADLVKMNAAYVSVIFKKEEGISYSHYLTKVRIEHAKKFLEQGMKAKDVCEKVGYFDYRYFNRQFKKYMGMTPDTYKKNCVHVQQ